MLFEDFTVVQNTDLYTNTKKRKHFLRNLLWKIYLILVIFLFN